METQGRFHKLKIYHSVEVFSELGMEKIKEKMRRKLSGLMIVS